MISTNRQTESTDSIIEPHQPITPIPHLAPIRLEGPGRVVLLVETVGEGGVAVKVYFLDEVGTGDGEAVEWVMGEEGAGVLEEEEEVDVGLGKGVGVW